MKTLLLTFVAAAICSFPCLAEIRVFGASPSRSRPFREGMGLIESLAGTESIYCCAAKIRRNDRLFDVDLATVLADTERDWPLEDGDDVYFSEHVFPCMDSHHSVRFVALIRDYMKIRRGEVERPHDWLKRLEGLPTHTKKTEPNK